MYRTQQFGAPGTQFRPQQYQYGTVSGYYPMQTTDWTSMFSAMMPMIMMIMMMAIMMPMMKGITASSKS
jgi:ATP-dependent Zn protease